MTKFTNSLATVAVLVILGSMFLMTGCSSDDDPVTPVPLAEVDSPYVPTELDIALWETVLQMDDLWRETDTIEYNLRTTKLPFPDTADQLMENFQTIYETMDVDEYVKLMHPDFLTILQEETINEFPDVGPTLDVLEEQQIHKHMFSGNDGADPNGDFRPGVDVISFHLLEQMAAWEMSSGDDLIPDTEWAPFEVEFQFDRGQEYPTLNVEGMIKFYVTSVEFQFQSVDMQFYQMIGQVDLTNSVKASEGTSWGTVKALFR